jgi:hypothetical protein
VNPGDWITIPGSESIRGTGRDLIIKYASTVLIPIFLPPTNLHTFLHTYRWRKGSNKIQKQPGSGVYWQYHNNRALEPVGKEFSLAIEIGHDVLQVSSRPRRRLDTCATELEKWTHDVARIVCLLFETIFQGVKMQMDHGLSL